MQNLSHLFRFFLDRHSPLNRPDPILNLLQDHRKKHTLIYLSFDNKPHQLFQSIIVDIDKGQRNIHIDDVFPREIRPQAGQSVTVSLRDAQHHWQNFQSKVLDTGEDKLLFGHLLALPEYIVGEQRREAYRIHLEGDCYWNSEDYRQHHSEIRDISVTGMQLSMGRFYQDHFELGQILYDCQLHIPGLDIECDLSVTRIMEEALIPQEMRAPVQDEEHITVGVRMLDMDASDRRQLEGYLMEEQRQRRQQSALSL